MGAPPHTQQMNGVGGVCLAGGLGWGRSMILCLTVRHAHDMCLIYSAGCSEALHGVTDSHMDDTVACCSLACSTVVASSSCTVDGCKCTILRRSKPSLSSRHSVDNIFSRQQNNLHVCVSFLRCFVPVFSVSCCSMSCRMGSERTTCMFAHVCACGFACLHIVRSHPQPWLAWWKCILVRLSDLWNACRVRCIVCAPLWCQIG